MPEPVARIAAAAPRGMIAVRADLSDRALRRTFAGAARAPVPEPLRWTSGGFGALAWMSPDELLLIVEEGEPAEAAARLRGALEGEHALVADVSDMRAAFRVAGPEARRVLAKLTPADLSPRAFGDDGFRRTRLGQVAAALRAVPGGVEVLGFRSHARYLGALLRDAASRAAPATH